MFHFKIWFGVILAAVLTTQIWMLQPRLLNDVAREQDRLRPVIAGQRLERGIRTFYKNLQQEAEKYAKDKELLKAVSEINYEAEDELTKTFNYQEVHKKLATLDFTKKIDKSFQRLYIVSRDGRALFNSTKPEFDFQKASLPKIPHLADALQERPRTGIWIVEGVNSFVAAVPVYVTPEAAPSEEPAPRRGRKGRKGAKKAEAPPPAAPVAKGQLKAALLYAVAFTERFFQVNKDILDGEAKGAKILLFTVTKSDTGTSAPSHLANNLGQGEAEYFLPWLSKEAAPTIIKKFFEGMGNDLLHAKGPGRSKGFSYIVDRFPSDLSTGDIGYALLVPIPDQPLMSRVRLYYRTTTPLLISIGCLVGLIVLGLLLSFAEIFYFRRVTPRLQAASKDAYRDIPLQGLSSPWKELVRSVNKIFSMLRERGLGDKINPTNAPYEQDET